MSPLAYFSLSSKIIMHGVSALECRGGGVILWFHSRAEGGCDENMRGRWADRASQIIIINRRVAARDIIAPYDETAFHKVKESG